MTIAESCGCKLRKLESYDLEILAQYANNNKIAINLRDSFPHPYSQENANEFYQMVKDQVPETIFVVDYMDNFSGIISLMPLNDVYSKSAEIGYWLAEPFWNKGIMTKAVGLMVHWGWKNLDIVRIHSGVFSYNHASARVLEKSGFTLEGEFINSIYKSGKYANERRYSILKP